MMWLFQGHHCIRSMSSKNWGIMTKFVGWVCESHTKSNVPPFSKKHGNQWTCVSTWWVVHWVTSGRPQYNLVNSLVSQESPEPCKDDKVGMACLIQQYTCWEDMRQRIEVRILQFLPHAVTMNLIPLILRLAPSWPSLGADFPSPRPPFSGSWHLAKPWWVSMCEGHYVSLLCYH